MDDSWNTWDVWKDLSQLCGWPGCWMARFRFLWFDHHMKCCFFMLQNLQMWLYLTNIDKHVCINQIYAEKIRNRVKYNLSRKQNVWVEWRIRTGEGSKKFREVYTSLDERGKEQNEAKFTIRDHFYSLTGSIKNIWEFWPLRAIFGPFLVEKWPFLSFFFNKSTRTSLI